MNVIFQLFHFDPRIILEHMLMKKGSMEDAVPNGRTWSEARVCRLLLVLLSVWPAATLIRGDRHSITLLKRYLCRIGYEGLVYTVNPLQAQ